MRLLYDNTGFIHAAVRDYKWHETPVTTFNVYQVDETDPGNKDLCLSIELSMNLVDSDGDGKYQIINDLLQEKDGWVVEVGL